MITPEQIKAARALLKWKQTTLAEEAGISLPSINNVERSIGSARMDTMLAIKTALERGGIQFISGSGVQLKEEVFEVHQHEGPDFIPKLYDDLLSCLKSEDDEVVVCSQDERMLVKHAPKDMMRFYHHAKKVPFKERTMLKQGDTYLISPPECYRWIAPELMGTVPYWIYKNRFVLIMWDVPRVVIIHNQAIADSFRQQFEYLWAKGNDLPDGLTNQLDDPDFVKSLEI